jgi:hypothetical protein
MGTWGVGAFENDGASDWAMELEDSSSSAPIKRAIARIAKTSPRRGTAQRSGAPPRLPPTQVDLDDAIEALAAAELIAAARGHASPRIPDELTAWIAARTYAPDEKLTTAAIVAVQRIADNSELKSEWNGDNAWQREQQRLVERLRKPPKPVRAKPAAPIVAPEPAKSFSDPQSAALERALKKLKLRVHVNSAGKPREIVPLDTPTITDADMHLLAPLATLEGLHLGESKITDAAAGHFRRLSKLTWAWLMETRVGDRTAAVLASSAPRLGILDLCETRITDRGLRDLARLGKLHDLSLRGTAVTDRGVAHLGALKQLKSLLLGETKVTGVAFRKFPANARLERLDLGDTRVTDAGLKAIARLTRLDSLWLAHTAITDAGVVHLLKLKRLTVLDLDGTRITDASIPHLARLNRLRSLYLAETAITKKGLDQLRKELSQTQIDVG